MPTAPRARRRTEVAFETLAETLSEKVRMDHPPDTLSDERPALRDAHPKHHGCVRATFEVRADIPAHLRQGLFATPATYDAEIRFSNAFNVRHDAVRDTRGMAIKLKNVAGDRVRLPVVHSESHSMMPEGVATQDFLLTTNSEFMAENAEQFVAITKALLLPGGQLSRSLRLLRCAIGLNPPRFRARSLLALGRMQEVIANPLYGTYFSQTPYRYGRGLDDHGFARAAKFCTRPGQRPTLGERARLLKLKLLAVVGAQSEFDFLKRTLHQYLTTRDASFDFCVQLRTPSPDPSAGPRMPLDNASYRWSTAAAPYVPVARIRIPASECYADREAVEKEMRRGQHLTFSPWHALADHRPLGSVNRARLRVYIRVSRMRHELNHTDALVGTDQSEAAVCESGRAK